MHYDGTSNIVTIISNSNQKTFTDRIAGAPGSDESFCGQVLQVTQYVNYIRRML